MKYFVKFSEDKFNLLKGCTTIKLTLLSECIEMEEGKKDNLEGRVINGFMPGTVNEGSFDLGYVKFGGTNNKGTVRIPENGRCEISYKYDTLVYCMAFLEEQFGNIEFGKERFGPKMESFFSVKEDNFPHFKDFLRQVFTETLRWEHFTEKSQKIINESNLNEIQIDVVDFPITYVEKKFLQAKSTFDFSEIIKELIFTKELNYKDDQEHRIAFLPYIGNRLLEFKEYIILPIPNLSELNASKQNVCRI